jgi:hypothetical protein
MFLVVVYMAQAYASLVLCAEGIRPATADFDRLGMQSLLADREEEMKESTEQCGYNQAPSDTLPKLFSWCESRA